MSVTAIIVTRGNVSLGSLIEPFPDDWQVLVWDNGMGELDERWHAAANWQVLATGLPDRAVYGRYGALAWARHETCYVQDDDCIVSNPAAIVAALPDDQTVVCNMPQEFRHDFYDDHALVGFGCAFHYLLPKRAFGAWPPFPIGDLDPDGSVFLRTCDIVFTGLTPRVLVDVPVRLLDYASDPNRMWKQPTHQSERSKVLDIVKGIAVQM